MLHCQCKLKGFFQRLNLMNLLRIPNRVQEALEREAFKILNSQPEQPYLPYILQTLHYQQCMNCQRKMNVLKAFHSQNGLPTENGKTYYLFKV